MSSPSSKAPTWKAVYTVVERPKGRSHWLRIGTAFVNRDGSYNVFLDALPVNGTLHIRDSEPKDDERTGDVSHRPVPHVSELSPAPSAS